MIALCLAMIIVPAFASPTAEARSHLVVSSDSSEFPDSVVATIPVGGDPTNVSVLPNGEYLYVGNETSDYVTVLRLSDRAVVAMVATGRSPWELMAHPSGDYVYAANLGSSSVSVIRTLDNTVVATIPVGASPCLVTFRPAGDFAYVANSASNNVSVIRTADNTVVATVGVGSNPRGIACLPDGNYVYTANCYSGNVSVIRASDNTVVATVQVGGEPHRVAALLDGSHVYVTRRADSKVLVIRTSDNTLVDSMVSGAGVCGMVMLPGSDYAYVANIGANSVSVVKTSDHSLVTTIPVGHAPWGVTTPAAGDFVYTANRYGQSVTAIGFRRQHDVGAVRILAPTGTLDSGTTAMPRALVRNFATSPEVFPVTMRIGAAYAQTVQDTLAPGADDTVCFPAWTATPVGTLSVICFTALAGDSNPANDTVVDSVSVRRASVTDVSTTVILAPTDTVDSGTLVIPAAVVHNSGTTNATFPVTVTIGTGYAQVVAETLPAGATDTISFPSWTAQPLGTMPVVCFTALVGDENPANDTLRDSVRVRRTPLVDAAVLSILSPHGTVDSGSAHTPSAVVRNYGQSDVVFPVTMRIGASYSHTISETLAAHSSDTVSFQSWNALQVGTFSLTCFTSLGGDEDPTNDTLTDSVRVLSPPRHDVGTVAILAPSGTVHTGDTVIPRARVTNLGNTSERLFDVRFRIGATYTRTASVLSSLLPDSSVELTFGPWVAVSGDWAVSCSTMLTIDADRTNDKVSSTLRVLDQARLSLEPDQSDRLQVGEGKTYRFYALLENDGGSIVEIGQPDVPVGWSLQLFDSAGTNLLNDTDLDGTPDLGYVLPGTRCWFSLEVHTPSGLVGDTASLSEKTLILNGHLGNDPAVADSALLDLTLVPGFSMHNFPNPLSLRTTFVIGLPEAGEVSLTIYTRAGARVCKVLEHEGRPAGVHLARWEAVNDHGREVAPGTYEYVLDYVHQGETDRIRKRLVVTRE